ncbi:VCBS repeat-containing protein [Ascidiimonas aurantiaca]|uniref:VCBS repeat-containing protein n=1 Tax=Ascidiimonas aurantiaca TaxID=1685432 RepID=UPI0030EC6D10
MNFKTKIPVYVWLTALSLLTSCQEKTELAIIKETAPTTLFNLMAPDSTGIDFTNTVENQKDFNIFKYRNFYNGGGVAIGDINNDSLPDVYLIANMGPNRLFLNKGNFIFQDITDNAGVAGNKPWSTGVTMVDIDQDGFLDIYVCNAGNMEGNNHDNQLFINNGDLTFTEKAREFNLAKSGFTTHAAFFDYDKDGDLDAYILNNSNIPVSSLGYAKQREVRARDWEGVPEIFRGVGDMLLRNDKGVFTDVSEEAGIYGSLIGFGLGVMVTDIDQDLYPDIYVSNDFYERDYLYINNRDGTFTESIKDWTSHLCLSAMGIDIADINNDGLNDIFITDMLPEGDERVKSVMEFEGYDVFKLKQSKDFYQQYIQNTLQLNNGNQSFSEIAYFSGVAKTDWSWAGLIFDMDNNGYRDIYVTNGVNHDLTDIDFVNFFANEIIQKMALTGKKEAIDSIINKMPRVPIPNYAFKNNKDLTFNNATDQWGLNIPSMSNGVAYGDLDNDGDLDMIVNNVNMQTFVFRNNANALTKNNHIRIRLEGEVPNRNAIGAKIKLYSGQQLILQELMPSRGFQSSMDYVMAIGLGDIEKIDSLRVIWPDDHTQLLTGVSVNQLLTLKQSNARELFTVPVAKKQRTLLTEITPEKIEAHKENTYVDFDYEGLIYQMLSQEGPALSVGDVNNDGYEDLFVGGAKGQPGNIYLNLGNGNLKKTTQKVLQKDRRFEDTASAMFDANGDGYIDLMVGSGGNQTEDKNQYRPRLYLNDGNHNFIAAAQPLPSVFNNISVIAPYDFDQDGDIDVFIGSRSVVGTYGIDPEHLFLENKGDGTFTQATDRYAYDLRKAGMITGAVWADIDGDRIKDLVTVSEWGTPKIYKNNQRKLAFISTALDSLSGWWNTIETADLDNDGDQDLILGNQGNNLPYQTSPENPVKMYINDFDNNGTIEQIITRHTHGKDYPIHMKKELTAQIVSLKKENLKAADYARKSIDKLFSKEMFENSIVKTAVNSQSLVILNDGNLSFTINPLPDRVQLSCICGIACADINEDGHTDLILGGNNFEFKPQFSRLDAGYGSVLLGDENGNFEWQPYQKSGFFIREEIKHIKTFRDKNGKTFLIAAINNNQPRIFSFND